MSGGIQCAFVGVLGRDGELKTSKAGKQYLKLSVRVGEQWLTVMLFGDTAIDLLTSGTPVHAEGTLTADAWIDRDGQPRPNLNVMSSHIRISEIGGRKVRMRSKVRADVRPQTNTDDFHNDSLLGI